MKRLIFILMLTILEVMVFAQISTTKIAQNEIKVDKTAYDSTQNFLGKDVYKYIGQDLYLNGKAESLRKYGYDGFVIDYNIDKYNRSNVYKCCDSYNAKYSEVAQKYFTVLDIIKHPKSNQLESLYGKKFYLKLQEKESKDILYYEYDTEFDSDFPFIVVGFYEKQKTILYRKEFVFSDQYLEGSIDINTGKEITTKTGQKWTCIDLTIEEEYYSLSLIIENLLGEKTTIAYSSVFGKWIYGKVYTINEANNYKKKFGLENFNRILQGKVKIGMTKEMCKLSWGEPEKINETITANGKNEQWVYSDNYLYFENGKLTAMQ